MRDLINLSTRKPVLLTAFIIPFFISIPWHSHVILSSSFIAPPPSFWPILSSTILLLNLPAGVGVIPLHFPHEQPYFHTSVFAVTSFIAFSTSSQLLIEKDILTQEYKVS